MFGSSEQERLLAAMFYERYGAAGGGKLRHFLDQVAEVTLHFDLVEQMRCQDYPGHPGFESGLPSKCSYFVPGSGYGGHNPLPSDPLSHGFVYATDGDALNFGSLWRLQRAITALLALPPADQEEPRRGLASSTKHLSTVEELIWAGVWRHPIRVDRPPSGAGKSHDWKIVFSDLTLNLECKFVPASWAALIDGDDFQLMKGTLTGKASAQLPNPAPAGSLNVAAITGITAVDDSLRQLCSSELREKPNVQVIAHANVAGQITIFSHSTEAAHEVRQRVEPWAADEFGGFSTITSFRAEDERRRAARPKPANAAPIGGAHGLIELQVPSLPPRAFVARPRYPYRYELVERLPTGEPVFRVVTPFRRSGPV